MVDEYRVPGVDSLRHSPRSVFRVCTIIDRDIDVSTLRFHIFDSGECDVITASFLASFGCVGFLTILSMQLPAIGFLVAYLPAMETFLGEFLLASLRVTLVSSKGSASSSTIGLAS